MSEGEQLSFDQEELTNLNRELQVGLNRMIEFEQKLNSYSKDSLILLIVLTANPDQFEAIERIVGSLDRLL